MNIYLEVFLEVSGKPQNSFQLTFLFISLLDSAHAPVTS